MSESNYDINGNICRASCDFVNLDRSYSLQVSMEFEFAIEDDEMFLCGAEEKTKVQDFESQFKQNGVSYWTAMNGTVNLYTDS